MTASAYTNRQLECDGRTMTFGQWELETGIPVQTLYKRIFELGWTVERALQTPVRRYRPPVKINGWHPRQETRGKALKRLEREGRKEEFFLVRSEILGRWLTARKKIKKIELFYTTLEQFPPLE